MATRSKCVRCHAKFDGKGQYCLNCVASVPTQRDTVGKKVRSAARAAAAKDPQGPVCPHCKTPLGWDNLGTSETEISIYVREKMYFCTSCRAILGFSSWHTEG